MKFIIAFFIMLKAHKGQIDKGGNIYYFHPIKVMLGVKGYKKKIVALLHDVVEDSNYTLLDLKKYFPNDIIEAVELLTKKKGQNYNEYLSKIKNNIIARDVKKSDLMHNMDLTRLKEIKEIDLIRFEKYKRAYSYLNE